MRRECWERFPRHRFQRKPLVSDPSMYHGTCVMHVSWCMSGSLIRGWRGKIIRHSRRMHSTRFYVSGKRTMEWSINHSPDLCNFHINGSGKHSRNGIQLSHLENIPTLYQLKSDGNWIHIVGASKHDDVIKWNIFRVTCHWCGDFTGSGEFPAQRPMMRCFDVFLNLRLN